MGSEYLEERMWKSKVNDLVRKGWPQEKAQAHVDQLRATRESAPPVAGIGGGATGQARGLILMADFVDWINKRLFSRRTTEHKKGSIEK